jgi:hypothetical protein
MSTPARRRLMRDFRRLQSDPPQGVTGAPMDDDIMKWTAVSDFLPASDEVHVYSPGALRCACQVIFGYASFACPGRSGGKGLTVAVFALRCS